MTVFKKDIRTWFALILSLLVLTAVFHYLAEIAYRSDAKEIETDPRYARISAEIHDQNLDAKKVRDMVSAEESPVKSFLEDIMGVFILFVSYGLIFRCVARLVFAKWKGPWIS